MVTIDRTSTSGRTWIEHVPPAYWVLGLILLVVPAFVSNFVMFQIFGWAFIFRNASDMSRAADEAAKLKPKPDPKPDAGKDAK